MDRLWIYRKRNAVASTAAPGSDELGRGPFSPGARQSHGKRSVLVTCPTFAGDAPVELSGAAFDATKLAEVSKLTGVVFPPGTRGVEYLYLGSGIDDSLAAKVVVPDDQIEAFLSNPAMQKGEDSKASVQIGRGRAWWKVDGLTDRIDRKQDLPDVRFLELSCGREAAEFVVYLSWWTM